MLAGTKLYIAVVAGLVLLGGGAAYVYVSSTVDNDGAVAATDDAQGDRVVRGTGPLSALLGSGASLRCTISHTDEEASVEGVSYIDGERMKGEYVMTQEDEHFKSWTYTDGVTMYTWSETPMGVRGTKIALTQNADESLEHNTKSSSSPEATEEFGYEDDVEYECAPWRVDESVFVIPNDIEFVDMSVGAYPSFDIERDGIENFPPSAPSMDELPGLDCSICADLPSGPREACLESLSCGE